MVNPRWPLKTYEAKIKFVPRHRVVPGVTRECQEETHKEDFTETTVVWRSDWRPGFLGRLFVSWALAFLIPSHMTKLSKQLQSMQMKSP
mmetsp:Transcript_4070/g.6426  ORF Transcript_4070/g.6426 Transcript_4070/m.6426 type:complete len:89 (-) Transcript_4070:32-298(-)